MSAINVSSLALHQPFSTTPPNPKTALQAYFKARHAEVQQLNDALKSGDLSAAQQIYSKIVALGQQVLHKDNPFLRPDRALDFSALGGAIQNGDLDGARQAFAALQSTYVGKLPPGANSSTPPTVVSLSNTSTAGSEIILSSSAASGADVSSESGVNVIA
jgi:hypothetical protein